MARILVVDDELKILKILSVMLKAKGYSVETALNPQEAFNKLKSNNFDLIISDIKMPEIDGIEFMKKVFENYWQIPFIFITAFADVDSAVKAMREGAIDYIPKPFEEERIFISIERALGVSKIIKERDELKEKLNLKITQEDIICESPSMRKILMLIQQILAINENPTILFTGESGVGKDVLSRYTHNISKRKNKKYIPVNCTAIPSEIVESELFGYEKGAFTGANQRKIGIFEAANGGTVFLDEIGDLPLNLQGKLLRVLQEKKITRVGGYEEIPVDVMIISATNKNLEKLVNEGKFREDLYYRLNVFPIHIPPLRERKEDIIPLAKNFLKNLSKKDDEEFFTKAVENFLLEYPFPGNVRELKNAMERAYILAGGKFPITIEHISFLSKSVKKPIKENFVLPDEGISLEELEKNLIAQALEKTGGNKSKAARLLGLTRSKLRTRLKLLENKND